MKSMSFELLVVRSLYCIALALKDATANSQRTIPVALQELADFEEKLLQEEPR